MNWLRRHFEKHRERTPWSFLWRVTLEDASLTLLSVVLVFQIARAAGVEIPHGYFSWWSPHVLIFWVIIAAPMIETLLAQALPITVARRFGARFGVQVAISTLIFAFLHLIGRDWAVALSTGLIGGGYLSFTYAHWSQHSFRTAYRMTVAQHAIFNSLAVIALLASGGLSFHYVEVEFRNCPTDPGMSSLLFFHPSQHKEKCVFALRAAGDEMKIFTVTGKKIYGGFQLSYPSSSATRVTVLLRGLPDRINIAERDYDLANGAVFLVSQEAGQFSITQEKADLDELHDLSWPTSPEAFMKELMKPRQAQGR